MKCSKQDKACKNTGIILEHGYKRCMNKEEKTMNLPVCNFRVCSTGARRVQSWQAALLNIWMIRGKLCAQDVLQSWRCWKLHDEHVQFEVVTAHSAHKKIFYLTLVRSARCFQFFIRLMKRFNGPKATTNTCGLSLWLSEWKAHLWSQLVEKCNVSSYTTIWFDYNHFLIKENKQKKQCVSCKRN